VRLGVFPGTFNPPTTAHFALIEAAAAHTDEVRVVLPRAFPHKIYHGATLEQRVEMLKAVPTPAPVSVAVSEGGLFIDIARECRTVYGPETELWFLCGRDAADRIIHWDYGRPNAIDGILDEFGLLVASRWGEFSPPSHLAHRVRSLQVPPGTDAVSSTQVREQIARNQDWAHLVPPEITGMVGEIYRRLGD
jgi:nicotinate-nucleotide adenylyltransferase